jgi:hypothetical protein
MHDANLLFSDNQQITTNNTRSSTILDISTWPIGGLWVEIAYTAATGTAPELRAEVLFSDEALVGDAEQGPRTSTMNATGGARVFVNAHSRRRYAVINYLVAGTSPVFSNVTAGVVTGPQRESAASSW